MDEASRVVQEWPVRGLPTTFVVDAVDADDSGVEDISDPIYLLAFL